MRFLGNSEAKTDAKGRVFFPAVFRKQLQTAAEECLILRKDTYQDCLVLYPESVWNEQMNELRSKLNRWNSKHQMIFRQFVSDVEIITLDGNGRFLIPKRYLKLQTSGKRSDSSEWMILSKYGQRKLQTSRSLRLKISARS